MGYTLTMLGVNEGDQTRRTFAAIVTAGYFSTLNVHLAAGRGFSLDEERAESDVRGRHRRLRLRAQEGADPPGDVLGRRVRLNARDYTIVGVAPEGFAGTMALVAPEFWLPTASTRRAADDVFRNGRADSTIRRPRADARRPPAAGADSEDGAAAGDGVVASGSSAPARQPTAITRWQSRSSRACR